MHTTVRTTRYETQTFKSPSRSSRDQDYADYDYKPSKASRDRSPGYYKNTIELEDGSLVTTIVSPPKHRSNQKRDKRDYNDYQEANYDDLNGDNDFDLRGDETKTHYKRTVREEEEVYESPKKQDRSTRGRFNGSTGSKNERDLYYNSDSKSNYNPDNYPPIRMSREERERKYGDGSSNNKKFSRTSNSNLESPTKSSNKRSERKLEFASPKRDIVTTREEVGNKRIYTTISRSPVKPYKETVITSTIVDNFDNFEEDNDR